MSSDYSPRISAGRDVGYLQTGSGCGDAGEDEGGGVSGVGSGERAGWAASEGVAASLGAKNLSGEGIDRDLYVAGSGVSAALSVRDAPACLSGVGGVRQLEKCVTLPSFGLRDGTLSPVSGCMFTRVGAA
jgi:hypothetical protein